MKILEILPVLIAFLMLIVSVCDLVLKYRKRSKRKKADDITKEKSETSPTLLTKKGSFHQIKETNDGKKAG